MDVVNHVDKVIIVVYILLNNVHSYSMYVQASVRSISPISQRLQKHHRTKSNYLGMFGCWVPWSFWQMCVCPHACIVRLHCPILFHNI